VDHDDFRDAALVVLGHGSTKNSGSAEPAFVHAAELRRRGLFHTVREAFWIQEPHLNHVLATLTEARVFIAPLFISEGYICEEVIPQSLGLDFSRNPSRVKRSETQSLHYCKPIGSHVSMTSVLLARARQVVEQNPFPRTPRPGDTTLFIAGHGTERNENSRTAIEQQVKLIQALNIFEGVHAIFMEEEPRIPQCYALAQTRNLVVVPFFISDGLHTQEDIPVLLGETKRAVAQRLRAGQPTWRNPTEQHGKLVWYTPAVGTEPLMAGVILERVREAALWK